MIKAKRLDGAIKTLTNLFERSEDVEIIHLFKTLDESAQKSENMGLLQSSLVHMTRLKKFFEVLITLPIERQQALTTQLLQYLYESRVDELEEIIETLRNNSLINPIFHEAMAKSVLLNRVAGEDEILGGAMDSIESQCISMSFSDPEQYRVNIQNLPEVIQEHFANLETITKSVIGVDSSIHCFSFPIISDGSKVLYAIRLMPVGLPDIIDNAIIGTTLTDTCLLNVEHYLSDHKDEINLELMIALASRID